jgi:FkbM family methyltransferase
LAADLTLNLENGTKVVVPNRLDAMTTYVILEQERWFEKEWGFIPHLLQPGMIALDIGANLGTYTTAIAKAVGPGGQVFAYEPTSETRARLERTVAINDQSQVTVVASALSDTEREGRIVFGGSSELNHLGEASEGDGEAVHLTSLDLEKQRLGWDRIDFIKMDAEGEELKIIAGGSSVFEAGAPIVMFEIKAAATYEPAIARTLSGLGYGLYRLLPDERHLVPFDENEVDGFELNVFAVKPEEAPALVERDLLAEPSEVSPPSGNWAAWSGEQPFARMLAGLPPARLPDEPFPPLLAVTVSRKGWMTMACLSTKYSSRGGAGSGRARTSAVFRHHRMDLAHRHGLMPDAGVVVGPWSAMTSVSTFDLVVTVARGVMIEDVGFTAKRTTTGSPLEMPPRMPPAWLDLNDGPGCRRASRRHCRCR